MKKFIIALSLFFVAFIVPVSVYTVVSNKQDQDIRNQAAEKEKNESIPDIVSVPVTEVEIGEKYQYTVRVSDSDGDDIQIMVRERPEWLEWNSDMRTLSGTPESSDSGVHDVEITASDGKWLNTQKYQITVKGDGQVEIVESSPESISSSDSVSNTGSQINMSEYGLDPIAQTTSESTSSILGVSTEDIYNKSEYMRIIYISIATGLVVVLVFLVVDSQWNIVDKMFPSGRNSGQVSLQMDEGTVIKKRRNRL